MSIIEEQARLDREELQALRPQSYVERCELCGRPHRFDCGTRELIDVCHGLVIEIGPLEVVEMESGSMLAFERARR